MVSITRVYLARREKEFTVPVLLRENIYQARRLPRTDEILQGRSALLLPVDQALIEAVLIKGQSAVSLGRLMEVPPSRVRKKVHNLTKRLSSRKFLDAARALCYLSPADARIARKKYCQGLANREICTQEGISLYKLRRHLDRISAEIAAIKRFTKKRAVSPEVKSPEYLELK